MNAGGIGWPTKVVNVKQGDQAAFLLRSVLIAGLGGVDQIYLFTLKTIRGTARRRVASA